MGDGEEGGGEVVHLACCGQKSARGDSEVSRSVQRTVQSMASPPSHFSLLETDEEIAVSAAAWDRRERAGYNVRTYIERYDILAVKLRS